MSQGKKAGRNRTLTLTKEEIKTYRRNLLKLTKPAETSRILNKTICQNLFEALNYLPDSFVDLMFIDPPYNLTKIFNSTKFSKMHLTQYTTWMNAWFSRVCRLLKPNATVYICGDWRTSQAIYEVTSSHLYILNRITWEREKGRGAKHNWKNTSEDIWHCSNSRQFKFHVDRVKLKRKVLAPYRNKEGHPKDWMGTLDGNYRLTHPSNLWTDITVPFWSMAENTSHPTQKPEKLLAKIILASSDEQDIIFDPFAGVGTTAVVAKKLNRLYVGIELDEIYCCLAEKRLHLANWNSEIQGYAKGVFWERNMFPEIQKNQTHSSHLRP